MKLSYLGLMDTERSTIKATITTDHPASSYGMPVIVLEDGGVLDYTSAILLDYRVEKISEAERPLLEQWQRNMPPIDSPAATLGRKGGSVQKFCLVVFTNLCSSFPQKNRKNFYFSS